MSSTTSSTTRRTAGRPPERAAAPGAERPGPLPGWLLVVLGAGAAALSAVGSWHVSVWYDEAATVTAGTRSWSDLLHLVQQTNAVQGVFYAFAHLWFDVAGTSPLALRLPSALSVGVAAAGTAWLAARALPRRSAVAAGVVVALLPRVTWAGVEGRPFAPALALAVVLTVVLVVALERRQRRWWALYALAAALSVGVFVYTALLVVVHGLVLWGTRRTPWRERLRWLAASAAAAVAASPVVLVSSGQTSQLGIDERPSLAWVARRLLVNEFFLGTTPAPVAEGVRAAAGTAQAGTQLWQVAGVLLAVAGWAAAVVGLLRWRRAVTAGTRATAGAAGTPGAGASPGQLLALVVLWLALPAAVVCGWSVLVSPVYGPRYLVFCAPALAVLVGHGLAQLPARRWWSAVVVVLLVALVVPVYASQRTAYAKSAGDWSGVAAAVAAGAEPGDGVYFTPRYKAGPDEPGPSTVRQARVAYPAAFAGLEDLTLARSAADVGQLLAEDRPLADASRRLEQLDAVWVVRRLDQPAQAVARDDAVLEAAGLTGREVWRGPQDEVLVFERTNGQNVARSS